MNLNDIFDNNKRYWRTIMNKSSIQNFDCQSESVIEDITSDLAYNSLLEYNKNMNDKYNAIISYLKIMKDLYWT